MLNHDKNYTELCIENYFLGKITQPYQNKVQILIKFYLLKCLDLLRSNYNY